MAAVDHHHQHLQRGWALKQGLLEDRRQHLLLAARKAAAALRERWPVLAGVWLFGSSLKPAAFQRHSDLVIHGLPAAAQLEALGGWWSTCWIRSLPTPATTASPSTWLALKICRPTGSSACGARPWPSPDLGDEGIIHNFREIMKFFGSCP